MTQKERLIVSAYTGVLMTDMGKLQEFIEETLGRSVFTHELVTESIQREIKDKLKDDFLALCGN